MNPSLSADFSILVSDTAIMVYSPKTLNSSASYILHRKDSFYQSKNVQKFGRYLVIFSQQESSTVGKWDFKLQVNILIGSVSQKIG